jgi:hypothetical protein
MDLFDQIVSAKYREDIYLEYTKKSKNIFDILPFIVYYKSTISNVVISMFPLDLLLYCSSNKDTRLSAKNIMYMKIRNSQTETLRYLIFISMHYVDESFYIPYLIYLETCQTSRSKVPILINSLMYFIFPNTDYELTCPFQYLYYLSISNDKLKRLYLKSRYITKMNIRPRANIVN